MPMREQADRPAAEDRHRLAGEILAARGEDGVAERLLERRDLGRELGAVVLPDHRLGDGDELGERAVAVDAEDLASARTCARGRCGSGSRRRR